MYHTYKKYDLQSSGTAFHLILVCGFRVLLYQSISEGGEVWDDVSVPVHPKCVQWEWDHLGKALPLQPWQPRFFVRIVEQQFLF